MKFNDAVLSTGGPASFAFSASALSFRSGRPTEFYPPILSEEGGEALMLTYFTALMWKVQTVLITHVSSIDPEAEQGNNLVEMALILALVVVIAIAALQALGVDIVGKLMQVANALH